MTIYDAPKQTWQKQSKELKKLKYTIGGMYTLPVNGKNGEGKRESGQKIERSGAP